MDIEHIMQPKACQVVRQRVAKIKLFRELKFPNGRTSISRAKLGTMELRSPTIIRQHLYMLPAGQSYDLNTRIVMKDSYPTG